MASKSFEAPYYHDYISANFAEYLRTQSTPVAKIENLREIGTGGGLESTASFAFLIELYEKTKVDLHKILSLRCQDRKFIDDRTKACADFNKQMAYYYDDPDYKTVLGMEDSQGRIVIGPIQSDFHCKGGNLIAPIPEFLKGPHVTLFGPPDSAKMAINAVNCFHRQLAREPFIVKELLDSQPFSPKWGADSEDSMTPLRSELIAASVNLAACYKGNLAFTDSVSGKQYELAKNRKALPIKRFPGLALPSAFLFYKDNPLPLHLYDFALHLFSHWQNPEALIFYVPKIENDEEALYLHKMISTAEKMIKERYENYILGSVRLILVIENPRAIVRLHEIIDALYPYFVGASLGWHDYLGSTARIFKDDSNYRIPVKADPEIVIKYIKASHLLLADVVGSRGGIKIGGMYGILPLDADLFSSSFQLALTGFFKDLITQLKRGLNGFWVAHPDFVRIGLALVEAWRLYALHQPAQLKKLIHDLLIPKFANEIEAFVKKPDLEAFGPADPNFIRSLLVADLKESELISNSDPAEVRFNIFQSLQYLASWLAGNGCVALPTKIGHESVRVMDDLATAERSRWEVWHEIFHKRFTLASLVQIAHEELNYIRKDKHTGEKTVQVKWDARTETWYPIAFRIMLQLMSNPKPVEFASELLWNFTSEPIRQAANPWLAVIAIDPDKYTLDPMVERLNSLFSCCGSISFASQIAADTIIDLRKAELIIRSFSLEEILEAASFHGDIGESKATLEHQAASEQAAVLSADASVVLSIKNLADKYLQKFGFKFLIAAQGKSAEFLARSLSDRLGNNLEQELNNAREALWLITRNRMHSELLETLGIKISESMQQYQINGVSIALTKGMGIQSLNFGFTGKNRNLVDQDSLFQLASLSKSIASSFAIEFFQKKGISLATSVNSLLMKTESLFRLRSSKELEWNDAVSIENLLSHTALNLHYVKGFSKDHAMPTCEQLLINPAQFGYDPIEIVHKPNSVFQYSGGGFIVLQHLIEVLEKTSIGVLIEPFLKKLGLERLSFEHLDRDNCADGFLSFNENVANGSLNFPAFAAGAIGTSADVLKFLMHLETAFHNLEGSGPISHDTAIKMLYGRDLGSQGFMGCDMGLGIFTAEAGNNRLMIHQGANDGFRALFIHCFSGPDRAKGFVILCNADTQAVSFIGQIAQQILALLKMTGIDFDRLANSFDGTQLKSEEIVNAGYKQLLFQGFLPTLPESIEKKGPLDPLARYNILVAAEILAVSNQRFAQARNVLSENLPSFDPNLFGNQGKVMDSWESARHNRLECDSLELKLLEPRACQYISISTAFHDGNQPEFIGILGKVDSRDEWQEILPKTALQGHSLLEIALAAPTFKLQFFKINSYPDGGLSRLGLFLELPDQDRQRFKLFTEAKSCRVLPDIPKSIKPATIQYRASPSQVQKNLLSCSHLCIDYASRAFGGSISYASNEHFGPAAQLISPFPPLHMFDGFESARSRTREHYEEVMVKFGQEISIDRIVLDFCFFVNNNPCFIAIFARISEQWQEIVELTSVKEYAANRREFKLSNQDFTGQILLRIYPDGGINRLHVYGKQRGQEFS